MRVPRLTLTVFLLAAARSPGEEVGGELEALRRRVEALEQAATPPPSGSSRAGLAPPSLRGVGDKPFLGPLWRQARLGGYVELEHHSFRDETLGIPRGFRLHRVNLFIFSDVTDSVRFGSELELESEEPGEDLEVKVEMAWLDWVFFEELTLRGGAILAPLGRVNVNHDGPVRELTDRPLVSTFVVPTTLTEPGLGVHGRLEPHLDVAVVYEAYAVNGFRLLDRDGELAAPVSERAQLLREGRPSLGGDWHSAPATTGRLGLELGGLLQAGGSWHVGTYDERDDNLLTLLAADASFAAGPFALEGELAWAGFERDAFARTAGVPNRFWGGYVQAALSFLPEALRDAAPRVFGDPGARFAVVARYDAVDLGGDRAQAVEPGLTFRPFADTVFKVSYRIGLTRLGSAAVSRGGSHDDGVVFSLSTYF